MDDFAVRALAALTADVGVLLPDPGDPDLDPVVSLTAADVGPTGLGGLVGPHQDPAGVVTGRRVRATVAVGVRGADAADVGTRAGAVRGALLAARAGPPLSGTFLRISQAGVGELAVTDGPGPLDDRAEREFRFDVVYELLEAPSDTAGVIGQIAVDALVSRTGRTPRRLPGIRFADGVLDSFEAVDDPGAGNQAPSAWAFADQTAAIVQTSGIWGGTTTDTPNLPGTALLLRQAIAAPADVFVRADASSDERGIGLVARWQDPDNYYFLLLDATAGFRRIGRKVAGTFQELETAAFDDAAAYPTGEPLRVGFEVAGTDLAAHLNGEVVLTGNDTAIPGPGRVGLLTRRNPTAAFHAVDVWLL